MGDMLLEAILEYEAYIKLGNDLLKKEFNTTQSPTLDRKLSSKDNMRLIPTIGKLEYEKGVMSYRFHGVGCCFEFGDIIVDFDYGGYDMNFEYAGFKLQSLILFIETCPRYLILNNTVIFYRAMEELNNNGIIIKDNDPLLTNHRDYYLSDKGKQLIK